MKSLDGKNSGSGYRHYIAMFLVMMCTGYKGLGRFPVQFTMILLLIFIIMCLGKENGDNRYIVRQSTFALYAVHFSILLLTSVHNGESYNIIFIYIMVDILAFAVYLFFKKDFNLFVNCYCDVMFFLAGVSLLGHFYTNVLGKMLPFRTSGGRTWGYALIYCNIVGNDRNCGAFTEPGAFAEFLCIAILFELFWKKQWKRLVILIIAMITTYSTVGAILLILVILLYEIKQLNKWFGPVAGVISVVGIACLVTIGYVYFEQIIYLLAGVFPSFFGKILRKSVNYTARMEGPRILLQIFCKEPLFGVGYSNMHNLFLGYTAKVNGIDAPVSTLSTGLASFGIGGIIPYIGLLVGVLEQRTGLSQRIVFALFLWVCLFSQPHLSWMLMTCLSLFLLEDKNCLMILNR